MVPAFVAPTASSFAPATTLSATFRAHQLGLKNYAAPLPLLHPSLGKYDEVWEKTRAIFAEKYKVVLPCKL